jgi:hypothetical protein
VRKPRARGTAIDTARMASWTSRFTGYHTEVTASRISNWLARFDQDHMDVAARVLDVVRYVTHDQLAAALREGLGKLSSVGWDKSAKRKGKWRFAPFASGPADSGFMMLYKFKVANRLGFKKYNELFVLKRDLLAENLGPDDTVVFVDDISGSGDQWGEYWPELRELLPGRPRVFLLLVAVSTQSRLKIQSETDIKLIQHTELSDTDNIFSPACKHFTQAEKDALLTYCQKADHRNPKGWGNCGFVVVFAHRCPNDSIPVLHARNRRWTGLFER